MKFYVNNTYCPYDVAIDLFLNLFDYRWYNHKSTEDLIGKDYVAWNHITYRLIHIEDDSYYFVIIDE